MKKKQKPLWWEPLVTKKERKIIETAVKHNTPSKQNKLGEDEECRCDVCNEAWRIYGSCVGRHWDSLKKGKKK